MQMAGPFMGGFELFRVDKKGFYDLGCPDKAVFD